MTTSESIYKLIVENALTSILLSKPDGTILEANKAACDLFQYTRDELRQVGKKGIIDHSESNAPEKPEERKKDGKATGELTGIKKNGEHFPIEFSSVIFYDDNGDEVNCTTINDISERKKAEQEIAFLINNTSESYILLDKQLNIVSFNRQFQESYKKYFKQDIVKGKWIVDYAQPERKEAVKAIYKRVLQGTNEEYELIIPVQDGPEKIYSLRYHAAKDEKDVIIGVFVTATDITEERELKRKEDTLLKQSEQHNSFIETILQNLPIGIAVNNTKDGKATVINKSFSDIYGWDNEEISEVNTFFEKVYPDEIYREEIKQQVMADIESGDPEKMTWKNIMITTKAGKTRIINAKNIPLPEQGLMISTVVDVTNEFRHNAEINRTKIKQEALINGTTDLIWSVDANFCVITANNAYLEMMKMATNRLIVEGDKVLVPEFGEALNQKWESYYRRTLQGERFSIKEEVYNTVKKQMEYGKVSFNPVRNKAGEIFGIACFSKNITEETINLLALEKTKAELNKIMDSSMDMICAVDANGYFKKVSAACIHILGYKPEEMIEKHINDFIVAEDQERTNEAVTEIMSGSSTRYFENRYLHKNGQPVPLFWSARWDEKEKIRYGVARDATEKIKAEEEVKKTNHLLKNAQSMVHMGSWEYNTATDELFWSDEVYNIFGREKQKGEQLYFSDFSAQVHPEDISIVTEAKSATEKTGAPPDYIHRIILQNGEEKIVHEIGRLEYNKETKSYWVLGTVRDVTEEKIIARQLQKSQQEYKSLFENNPDAVFSVDLEGNFISANEMTCQISETTIEVLMGQNFVMYLPSDEIERVTGFFEEVKKGISKFYETKIITAKGNTKYISVTNIPITQDNKVTGVYGIIKDITNDVKAREYIKFQADLLDSVEQAVIASNMEGNIFYWNRYAEKLYGWKKEEAVGKSAKILQTGDPYYNELGNMLMQQFKEGKSWSGEFMLQNKKGKAFPVFTINSPVYDNKKQLSGIIAVSYDITERKLTEQAVAASQERFRIMFTKAPLGIALIDSLNGRIYDANETFASITGRSPNEIRQTDWMKITHPDDVQEQLDNMKLLNEKKIPGFNIQKRYIKPNGSVVWIQMAIAAIDSDKAFRPRHLCMIEDITERRQTEEKIRISNQRYEYVTRATFDAVWDWDIISDTIYWGEGFQSIFGYSPELLKPDVSSWTEHIHPDDIETVLNSLYAVIESSGSNWTAEYRYRKSDGIYAYVADRGIVIRNNNYKAIRMVGAIQDITHTKETELMLKELNDKLEKRAMELEASNTELERFAYVASHDLQEPLRMVSSFLQLLERKYKNQLDETAEQYIHFAIDGAKRMKTLIMDLLEYSRLGTAKNIAGKTDMNEVMEEVLITFSEQIKDLNASIETEKLPVLNSVIKVQMVQLLQNLVGNALKYHSDKKPAINISAEEDEHKWTFSVKDNGIGFDKKFSQKVFVIFQRLHHSNEYAGTGIGLSICKKIMDIHEGRIWVKSAEGEGSTFYFSIPKK